MKTLHLTIYLYLILFYNQVSAQQDWYSLPNSPIAASRFEDIYFLNHEIGWFVGRTLINNQILGVIYKTTDGGISWELQSTMPNALLRCVGFINENVGWIGRYDVGEFYRTSDGGQNLELISFPDPQPEGFCGIFIYDSLNVYAVGRFDVTPIFIKTNDGGDSWFKKSLSDLVDGLVDVYFFTPDLGIAVGTKIFNNNTKAVVLKTYNGGNDWKIKAISDREGEHAWKISFPSDSLGYVSIETFFNDYYCLKTINQGETWEEIYVTSRLSASKPQGIGFRDSNIGWIGFTKKTFKTTDGGKTWLEDYFGQLVNRFRFITDTSGYAIGKTIYKYGTKITNVEEDIKSVNKFVLHQNNPNPFNSSTNFSFTVPDKGNIKLEIFNLMGQKIVTVFEGVLEAGIHNISFIPEQLTSGVYFYKLQSKNQKEIKKMIYLR